jgi:hypothetical protein
MKKFALIAVLFAVVFVSNNHAAGCSTTVTTSCWTPASGPGSHVLFITWTTRATIAYPSGTNAQIQVVLKEEVTSSNNYIARYYNFDKNNAGSLSTANAIYSTLLTAKSTGEYVNLWLDASGNIADVQLGINP